MKYDFDSLAFLVTLVIVILIFVTGGYAFVTNLCGEGQLASQDDEEQFLGQELDEVSA